MIKMKHIRVFHFDCRSLLIKQYYIYSAFSCYKSITGVSQEQYNMFTTPRYNEHNITGWPGQVTSGLPDSFVPVLNLGSVTGSFRGRLRRVRSLISLDIPDTLQFSLHKISVSLHLTAY